MKRLLICLLLLFSCSAQADNPVDAPVPQVILGEPTFSFEPLPTHNVPKIRFDAKVTEGTVQYFLNAFEQVVSTKPEVIILEINSPGGGTEAGFKMMKVIEDSPIPVVCVVDEHAYSMAFRILQSCTLRFMTRRAQIMTHDTYFESVSGPATRTSLRLLLKQLDNDHLAETEHYCRRLKVSLKECREKSEREWWMTQQEALKVGAVDGVVQSVKIVVDAYRTTGKPPTL